MVIWFKRSHLFKIDREMNVRLYRPIALSGFKLLSNCQNLRDVRESRYNIDFNLIKLNTINSNDLYFNE